MKINSPFKYCRDDRSGTHMNPGSYPTVSS